MPRKFLKRYLPDPKALLARRELRHLGKLLEDPYLLHLNRWSVAGGAALGLFVAFIPLPGQMLIAAALAIYFRVNLVISVVMVWVTNPLTMPPIYYFCYRVGSWILGPPEGARPFQPRIEWFWEELNVIWQPFLLGSLLMGLLSAGLAYGVVQMLWRLHIVRAVRRRRDRRRTPR